MTQSLSARSSEVNRSGDFYSVQLASGEVKKWTLDQLDAAYRASFIDEETYVLPKGATSWSTLAEVVAAEPEPPSIAPPPVVADIDVAFDAADDDDELPAGLRPKRRVLATLFKLTAFAAVIGGVAFVAIKHPALVETVRTRATAMIAKPAPFKVSVLPVAAAVAAPPVVAPVVAPQPVAVPAAPAVATPPAPAVAMTTSGIPIVTAATEKAKPASKPEKAKKKAAPARHKSKAGTPFNKSGDAHDPLNGNL